ncbi:MAG: Uma2 family endonuclease [Phototrophicaceae bacterium]
MVEQPFWERLNLPAPDSLTSLQGYCERPNTAIYMELVNGMVHYPNWGSSSELLLPQHTHQQIVFNVGEKLKRLNETKNGQVLLHPFDLFINPTTILQPDVAWLKARSACQKQETYYQGAPELLVEVISDSTARRDRTLKFRLYEQIMAQEYWIIDPRDLLVEAYSFREGRLQRMGGYEPGQRFASPVLQVDISVTALFR